jgi:diacylglycerol O-acyltransferase / wax synthase
MPRARLTSLDASFLEVESPTAHMHVGWAAAFSPPEKAATPAFEELRDFVGSRLARAPRYRQKLAEDPLGLSEPIWVDDPSFAVARHVLPAESGDMHEVVDAVMSAPLPHDRPLWELHIADRLDDGRIGVVGKVHHAMVDGIAAVALAALLLDPTPDPPPPEPDDWDPLPEPSGVQLLAEGALHRASQVVSLARLPLDVMSHPARAAELLGSGTRALRAVRTSFTPAPSTPLNRPISPRRHLAWTRRPLEELRAIKRRHGATVNDVLLAAVAGALRRFLPHEDATRLKAMVPVSLRATGAEADLGNRISFVFVELPCEEPDPVRRLRDVRAGMAKRKAAGEPEGAGALLDAVEYAPRTLKNALAHLAASSRTFNLVVSNIPGPRQPLYMRGCRLEESYPVVPLADRHAVSIGMTTVDDQACFGVYTSPDALARADELAGALADAIDELVEYDSV